LSGRVVLQNNGGNDLTVTSSGSFAFSQPLSSGAFYSVKVLTQPGYPPKSQTCTVTSGGSGSVPSKNVTSVAIDCTTNAFTIGGTITGLSGTLVLQRYVGDPFPLTANAPGPFTFGQAIPSGNAYNVTVKTQSSGQACTVTKASGVVQNANV